MQDTSDKLTELHCIRQGFFEGRCFDYANSITCATVSLVHVYDTTPQFHGTPFRVEFNETQSRLQFNGTLILSSMALTLSFSSMALALPFVVMTQPLQISTMELTLEFSSMAITLPSGQMKHTLRLVLVHSSSRLVKLCPFPRYFNGLITLQFSFVKRPLPFGFKTSTLTFGFLVPIVRSIL
ncbi:hypothetical protein DPMN_187836 [Dreissena polymorpha]|uniref:Uncharacterized protein n=1 Tax=Dreissena polymorpha TaxID=45954 RepID=A0A9D4DSB7_DREPO|nr:hypothetical protein DPMN_187836 [Dreissena polymorpha]